MVILHHKSKKKSKLKVSIFLKLEDKGFYKMYKNKTALLTIVFRLENLKRKPESSWAKKKSRN